MGDYGNLLKLNCGDDYTLSKFTKKHQIASFKWVNDMACKLYLNRALKKKKDRKINRKTYAWEIKKHTCKSKTNGKSFY